MTKKFRKAPQGTASITSFFANNKKSSDTLEDGLLPAKGSDATTEIISIDISESEDDADGCENEEVTPSQSSSGSDWEETSKLRRSKRLRKPVKKYSDSEADEDDDDDIVPLAKVRKREDGKLKSSASKKVFPIFAGKGANKQPPTPPRPKVVDLEVLAFLKSGINEATLKAQKLNEFKREVEETTKNFWLFPVISHVLGEDGIELGDPGWRSSYRLHEVNPLDESSCTTDFRTRDLNGDGEKKSLSKLLCCSTVDVQCSKIRQESCITIETEDDSMYMPWITKYKVNSKADLAAKPESVQKVYEWLKLWKRSIRDDGGKSRQYVDKRRFNSDSEEDHEDEMKSKAVVLYGNSGVGKSATVLALAEKLNYKVVEVNFSTSRSGKEVLKRVEEATLSNRLQAGQDCLLLFEDITLVHQRDDEGFFAAVAQLITASCRPIVMTFTTTDNVISIGTNVVGECDTLMLDPKLLKKEPLYIYFPPPEPSTVLEKAIIPIVEAEMPSKKISKRLRRGLDSIVRHCMSDVRKSINYTQLFLSTRTGKLLSEYHDHVCPYLDLWYLRPDSDRAKTTPEGERIDFSHVDEEESSAAISKARKLKELDAIKSLMDEITLYDTISTRLELRQHEDLFADDDAKCRRLPTLLSCFTDVIAGSSRIHFAKVNQDETQYDASPYIFESDRQIDLEGQREDIHTCITQYCANDAPLGGCGLDNYESHGCIRTIVKGNHASSEGRRNRRQTYYFNCIDRGLVDKIAGTFMNKR